MYKEKWDTADDMVSSSTKVVDRCKAELDSTRIKLRNQSLELQGAKIELEMTKSDLYETRVELEDARTQLRGQNIMIKELKSKLIFEAETNRVARRKLEKRLVKAKSELDSMGQYSRDYELGDLQQLL